MNEQQSQRPLSPEETERIYLEAMRKVLGDEAVADFERWRQEQKKAKPDA